MGDAQKITRIHFQVDEQDIPVVFGIVSSDPDYRLSLKLNKELKISLKNISPVEFADDKGNKMGFSRFYCAPEASDSYFQLVSNRSGKNFMLRKLINIDYLLLLYNRSKDINLENIVSQLREIDSITGVFNIEIKTLKDRNLRYLI